MITWIALLRGVNVGGNNILPMKDLRAIVEALGHKNVRTYIQSGNCVFQANETDNEKIAAALGAAIEKQAGFRPAICVLTKDQLDAAIAKNPFDVSEDDLKNVYLYFLLEKAPAFDAEALRAFATQGEAFLLSEGVFYLHAPNGVGRSKLAEKLGKFLTVETTARNLRSAKKIADLASSGD